MLQSHGWVQHAQHALGLFPLCKHSLQRTRTSRNLLLHESSGQHKSLIWHSCLTLNGAFHIMTALLTMLWPQIVHAMWDQWRYAHTSEVATLTSLYVSVTCREMCEKQIDVFLLHQIWGTITIMSALVVLSEFLKSGNHFLTFCLCSNVKVRAPHRRKV